MSFPQAFKDSEQIQAPQILWSPKPHPWKSILFKLWYQILSLESLKEVAKIHFYLYQFENGFKLCVINLPFATIWICFHRPLNAGRVQKSHIFKYFEKMRQNTITNVWYVKNKYLVFQKKNCFMLVNAVIFLL